MLGEKEVKGTSLNNRIVWILLAYFVHFIVIGSGILAVLFELLFERVIPYDQISDGMIFVLAAYLIPFLPAFIWFFVYTVISKKNRPIFRSALYGYGQNTPGSFLKGLLAGFVTNAICVLAALLRGDIKLSFNFYADEIPFYLFALVCVCIQSSTEELWNRGFIMERVWVQYPVWVAILVNSLIFGALHLMNPGVSVLPIVNIVIVGIAYSIACWNTESLWFVMAAHTAWNFTQNLIFGLPNSGLVSRISVFKLEAANMNDPLFYDSAFGVEGSLPATIVNIGLAVYFIWSAKKQGRLDELNQSIESREKVEVLSTVEERSNA